MDLVSIFKKNLSQSNVFNMHQTQTRGYGVLFLLFLNSGALLRKIRKLNFY